MFEIKGTSVEEKFRYLENVLPRYFRRIPSQRPVRMAPMVLSQRCQGDDFAFAAHLPAGKLGRLLIWADTVLGEGDVEVELTLVAGDKITKQLFKIKNSLDVKLNIPITAATRCSVRCVSGHSLSVGCITLFMYPVIERPK